LLCEQVEYVTGDKAPRSVQARKQYVDKAWGAVRGRPAA